MTRVTSASRQSFYTRHIAIRWRSAEEQQTQSSVALHLNIHSVSFRDFWPIKFGEHRNVSILGTLPICGACTVLLLLQPNVDTADLLKPLSGLSIIPVIKSSTPLHHQCNGPLISTTDMEVPLHTV